MKRLLILAASLSLAACAGQSAPPSHPNVSGEPSATPAADGPDQVRIKAGGIPGGSPHIWGPRTIDLRKANGGWEVRVHDAEDFQGVGMEPHEMSPTRHTCTAWERLPDDIAARAKVASLELGGEHPVTADDAVNVILPWFNASSGPPPKQDPKQMTDHGWSDYFGRKTGGC